MTPERLSEIEDWLNSYLADESGFYASVSEIMEYMSELLTALREAVDELTRLRRMPIPGQVWRHKHTGERRWVYIFQTVQDDDRNPPYSVQVAYCPKPRKLMGQVWTKLNHWLAWAEHAEVVDG